MKKLREFLYINFGIFITALAISIFISPFNIVAGGVSGIGILLESIFTIDFSIFVLIINVVLVFIGYLFLGKEYFLKTIYGSISFPLYLMLIGFLFKQVDLKITDMFLSIIFASVLTGFGLGLAIKHGGNTGGVDIIQAILFKTMHIPYSKSMFLIDGVVVALGAIFIGFQSAMYGLIYVILVGIILDNVIFGGFNKRCVFIITDEEEKVKDIIFQKLQRGATDVIIEKSYTRKTHKMILCVMSTNEYFILRNEISKIDPQAFLFVTKSTEVLGLGFSIEDPSRQKRTRKK